MEQVPSVPLDNLPIGELRTELQNHGVNTEIMKRKELDDKFKVLGMGIYLHC